VITKKGFKTNRGTNNNIHILIKIIENAYEYSVQRDILLISKHLILLADIKR
jgi:hypothetical protein